MFVVRIIQEAEDKIDFKAFTKKEGAQSRFQQAYLQTHDGEFDSVAIFEVEGENDPGDAIEKVKSPPHKSVRLLEIKQSFEKEIEKLTMNIEL